MELKVINIAWNICRISWEDDKFEV